MNKKDLLDRCARSGEERVLLARVMDKLELAQNRGVPAHTPFLSPGERAAVEDLLRLCGPTRSLFWGGYPDAERAACVFLPDWQEAEDVTDDPEGPVAAVEGTFPTNADLGHRDVLGALSWGTSCSRRRAAARWPSCGRPCPSSCPSGRGPGGGKSPWGRSRCMSCARPRPP